MSTMADTSPSHKRKAELQSPVRCDQPTTIQNDRKRRGKLGEKSGTLLCQLRIRGDEVQC